jgi:hypothetical protein
MGSHAEKDYIEKTLKFLDGIIIGANLVEATPGATASLLVRIGGGRLGKSFYLDPMTYAFGSYIDDSGIRTDLDWIKSDQKRSGEIIRNFKRSYVKLSNEYGAPVLNAVKASKSITTGSLKDDRTASEFCRRVAEYQLDRLAREFREDPEYARYADSLPTPEAVFAPYFYMETSKWGQWLELNIRLAVLTMQLGLPVPVHAVALADCELLDDPKRLMTVANEFRATGVGGLWFWFSRFDELLADADRLKNFRATVEALAENGIQVMNMHGGYFSLALSRYGLSGISHGVGYGEQKDVMPVIGQSTPTVRYYLPSLRRRLGVPEVQRCFKELGITRPEHFFDNVCDCVICRGVLSKSIEDFAAFGDVHYATPSSKRRAQTPAAAKRCRFHFLLNRIKERNYVGSHSAMDIVNDFKEASIKWGEFEWLRSVSRHLIEWQKALA